MEEKVVDPHDISIYKIVNLPITKFILCYPKEN